MRYTLAAAAIVGAVVATPNYGYAPVSQIGDGQLQAPTGTPATTAAPYVPATSEAATESTVYSTEVKTITSCHPTVKSCPAESTVVSTTSYPVVYTQPTTTPVATSEESSSTPVYVASSESSTPVVSASTPVETSPVETAPVVTTPVGTSPPETTPVAVSSECPPPSTVYSTVTVTPSGYFPPSPPAGTGVVPPAVPASPPAGGAGTPPAGAGTPPAGVSTPPAAGVTPPAGSAGVPPAGTGAVGTASTGGYVLSHPYFYCHLLIDQTVSSRQLPPAPPSLPSPALPALLAARWVLRVLLLSLPSSSHRQCFARMVKRIHETVIAFCGSFTLGQGTIVI